MAKPHFSEIDYGKEEEGMKDTDSKKTMNRRNMLAGTGLVTASVLGASALSVVPTTASASTDIPAAAEKKCGTCRYWGGVRRISEDGQTVTAEGTGWCNNPDSPAYQRETKPTQGAPVWTKWDALG